MNPEINSQPPQAAPRPKKERVIQPSADLVEHVETRRQHEALRAPIVEPNPMYPDPIKSIEPGGGRSASQSFALAATEARAKENNRPVSMRVKSLMIVAVLGIIGAIYSLIAASAESDSSASGIVGIIGLAKLGLSGYLLLGKDHNSISLILRIYLIFQLISLFTSFASPDALVINGFITVFFFYVYARVRSLSYY